MAAGLAVAHLTAAPLIGWEQGWLNQELNSQIQERPFLYGFFENGLGELGGTQGVTTFARAGLLVTPLHLQISPAWEVGIQKTLFDVKLWHGREIVDHFNVRFSILQALNFADRSYLIAPNISVSALGVEAKFTHHPGLPGFPATNALSIGLAIPEVSSPVSLGTRLLVASASILVSSAFLNNDPITKEIFSNSGVIGLIAGIGNIFFDAISIQRPFAPSPPSLSAPPPVNSTPLPMVMMQPSPALSVGDTQQLERLVVIINHAFEIDAPANQDHALILVTIAQAYKADLSSVLKIVAFIDSDIPEVRTAATSALEKAARILIEQGGVPSNEIDRDIVKLPAKAGQIEASFERETIQKPDSPALVKLALLPDVQVQRRPSGSATTITMHEERVGTFKVNSADLNTEGKSALDAVAPILHQEMERDTSLCVEIHGHTDHTGSDLYNLLLSNLRASNAATYLKKEHRIPSSILSVKGFGKSRPIAPNDTPEGRAKNRRAEIVMKRDPPLEFPSNATVDR